MSNLRRQIRMMPYRIRTFANKEICLSVLIGFVIAQARLTLLTSFRHVLQSSTWLEPIEGFIDTLCPLRGLQ